METKETYYLYWIKRKTHTNMKTQGYIGITNKPERRFREHKCTAKDRRFHIHYAINKYDDLEYKVICVGDKDYIRELEYKLRPEDNIGWNSQAGGMNPNRELRSKEVMQQVAESISKLTKLDILNILYRFYENGESRISLSKEYKVSETCVDKAINGCGIRFPELQEVREVFKENQIYTLERPDTLTEDLYDRILTKKEEGVSLKELSKMFNIPEGTIEGYCKGRGGYLRKFSCFRIAKSPGPKKYNHGSKELSLSGWEKETGIPHKTLYDRIERSKWSIEKALTTPVNKNKSKAGKARKRNCQ